MNTPKYEDRPLSPEEEELAELMADLSEDGFFAGWISGNEYGLWFNSHIATPEIIHYGNSQIDPGDLQRLRELSAKLNGWIVWVDDENFPLMPVDDWGTYFITMENWLEHLQSR